MVKQRKKRAFKSTFDFGHFSGRLKPGLKLGGFWILGLVVMFLAREFWIGWKHSIWDGSDHFSIAYESNGQVSYVHLDQRLREVTIMDLPGDLMLPLAYGYGEYRVDKIKPLADQEKIKYGELLRESLTYYMGVHVDSYMTGVGEKEVDLNWMLIKGLFKLTKTDMSSWDMIRLLMFTRNLRTEQIKPLSMIEEGVLIEETLPDHAIVHKTDIGKLDNMVLLHFADPDFLADTNTWEIFNGTFYDGFGASVKRLVANSGFDVVGVRQATVESKESMLEVQEKDMNANIRKFAEDFGFRVVYHSDSSRRSTVRLVIGDDYWQSCCVR